MITKEDAQAMEEMAHAWALEALELMESKGDETEERLKRLRDEESVALETALNLLAVSFWLHKHGRNKDGHLLVKAVLMVGRVRAGGKFLQQNGGGKKKKGKR